MKQSLTLGSVAQTLTVGILTTLWAVPSYLIIVNSITPVEQYNGAPVWWPNGFGFFENFLQGWEAGKITVPFLNSIAYSVLGAALAVGIAALGAFALVILPIRNRKLWFWLIYSGTLLPLQVFAVPLYFASASVGLYNTKTILVIVYTALCIPFAFFVARNFLTTIPTEIGQAAKLDGAGGWRLFWNIYLPLMKPAIAAGFVLQFVYIWNELFFGISLVISRENQPVMAALASLQSPNNTLPEPAILATAVVVSLPAVLVFLIFQRQFVNGLTSSL